MVVVTESWLGGDLTVGLWNQKLLLAVFSISVHRVALTDPEDIIYGRDGRCMYHKWELKVHENPPKPL